MKDLISREKVTDAPLTQHLSAVNHVKKNSCRCIGRLSAMCRPTRRPMRWLMRWPARCLDRILYLYQIFYLYVFVQKLSCLDNQEIEKSMKVDMNTGKQHREINFCQLLVAITRILHCIICWRIPTAVRKL